MTATDELRRLLDERDVEWEDCGNGATYVEHNGEAWRFDYDEPFDQLGIVCLSGYTPAQAIATTLGDVPSLPYFWTADGTLHIELPKLPESISVRLPDQRDREVSSARTWQYTLGTGTCHIVKASRKYVLSDGTELFEDGCSVCNCYIGEDDNYCSNCGAKVVDA